MMKPIRIAIIGVGNIGTAHVNNLLANEMKNVLLTGLCDNQPEKLAKIREKLGESYLYFTHAASVFSSSEIDAVIIATPHYDHPILAIEALKAGKHVLIEKPVGVYTKKVQEMLTEAKKHPELTLALMYNQRMNPLYQKAKELVDSGEIGELRRTNWIITDWYRSQSYYDSSNWRATWKGEGGGVLLNQDPHQLDLWQWICGMPQRIFAFTYNGKRRNVEVETEVTAYVEYQNGATGVFVTTTTETPGTNRFEIVGSKGKIVIEDQQLKFWQTRIDETTWNQTYTGGFGEPEVWSIKIPVTFDNESGHKKITQNFINHILFQEELVSPAEEGIKGLSISNAIHLSSWLQEWVPLPINEHLFLEELTKKIETSTEKQRAEVILDTKKTY